MKNRSKKMPIECHLLFARKGQTERPRILGALAQALGAEATTAYLREDRPGSS